MRYLLFAGLMTLLPGVVLAGSPSFTVHNRTTPRFEVTNQTTGRGGKTQPDDSLPPAGYPAVPGFHWVKYDGGQWGLVQNGIAGVAEPTRAPPPTGVQVQVPFNVQVPVPPFTTCPTGGCPGRR